MFSPNRKENPALAERTINDHGYAVAGARKQLIYILQLLQHFVVFFQNKFADFKTRHGFRRTAQSLIILHAIALGDMRKILFEYPRKTLAIIPITFVFQLRKFLRRRRHALCQFFGIVKHAFPLIDDHFVKQRCQFGPDVLHFGKTRFQIVDFRIQRRYFIFHIA